MRVSAWALAAHSLILAILLMRRHWACSPPAPPLGRRHALSLRSTPPQLILRHDHRPTVPPCTMCRCRGWLRMMETLGGCGTICIGEASNVGVSCGRAEWWRTRPRHKSHDEDNQDHGGCHKSPLGHPRQ